MPATTPLPAMRLAVTAAQNASPMAPILLRGNLAECLDLAKEMHYKGVEIHVPDIWNFNSDELRKTCRKTGVAVAALVSGQLFVRKGLSISDDDPEIVAKAEEGLRLFIDAAALLETGVVIGWVRGKIAGRNRDAIMEKQGRSLALVDAYAAEKAVPLYVEAINRYELDSLNSAGEIVAFIRKYDLKNTFVHLDTFHMNIEESSPVTAITTCGPLLGYFHVADNTRRYPGHDELDFHRIFSALRSTQYTGFVTVECLPLPDGSEAAQRAHSFLTNNFPFLA